MFFLGLGGLEKVLCFVAVSQQTTAIQMETVLNLTPDYIWMITNLTLFLGLVFLLIGLLLFAKKQKG